MFLLGVNLPERRLVKIALTNFVGIGHHTARQICARLSFHDKLTVGELTDHQVSRLAAFLAAPSTAPPTPCPVAPFAGIDPPSAENGYGAALQTTDDPLQALLIENDLRREVQANIMHHRAVGSYKGKRHAMGFPVRGQNTRSNAETAKRLNTIERRAFSTSVSGRPSDSPAAPLSPLRSALRLALDRRRAFAHA